MIQGMIGSLEGIEVRESLLHEPEDMILIHKGQIKLFKNAFDTYKEWEKFQHKKLVVKIFGIEIWKNRTLHTTANVRFRWLKAVFTQIAKATSYIRKRCVQLPTKEK